MTKYREFIKSGDSANLVRSIDRLLLVLAALWIGSIFALGYLLTLELSDDSWLALYICPPIALIAVYTIAHLFFAPAANAGNDC